VFASPCAIYRLIGEALAPLRRCSLQSDLTSLEASSTGVTRTGKLQHILDDEVVVPGAGAYPAGGDALLLAYLGGFFVRW
jgi:hypothetical protein